MHLHDAFSDVLDDFIIILSCFTNGFFERFKEWARFDRVAIRANQIVNFVLPILHTLNIDFELGIEKLIYEKTELDSVAVAMAINDGVLDVTKLDAKAFGGTISQTMTLDINPNPARLSASQKLSNIDVARLAAANDIDAGITGKASLDTSVTARGLTAQSMKQTLSGSSSIELVDGRFLKDNIERRICQSVAIARQTPLTQSFSNGTDLQEVTMSIRWSNGKGLINPMSIALANARLSGDGTVDLLKTSFDMRLLANVSGSLAGSDTENSESSSENGCEINERYRDIQWPIRCQGDAADSSCGVDNSRLDKMLGNIAKAKAKEAVDKELDKQRDKLQEKLGDELGNALRGLFR